MMRLDEFRLNDIPGTAFYIPDFIGEERENFFLGQIERTPRVKWTQLQNRRLMNLGGVPRPKGMLAEPLPPWLQSLVNDVNGLGHLPPRSLANHVLLNEYTPGQGIMPHVDGDLFFPTITTVNLGSHAVLKFYDPVPKYEAEGACLSLASRFRFSLLLQPRSLLILKDNLYNDFLHGIEEVEADTVDEGIKNIAESGGNGVVGIGDRLVRGTRISLTIRNVPKTSKAKILL